MYVELLVLNLLNKCNIYNIITNFMLNVRLQRDSMKFDDIEVVKKPR